MRQSLKATLPWALAVAVLLGAGGDVDAKKKKKDKKTAEDPYSEYVWPPPPDPPRIKLEQVLRGRIDVEVRSRWRRKLVGDASGGPYDTFKKPFAVDFDSTGRILVTDTALGALIRIDRAERKMDVFGTRGAVRLRSPMGLDASPDGTTYVADIGLDRVVAFDGEGGVQAVFGREGDLVNPTDAALSPDGSRLFVADSKAHAIVVFDLASGDVVRSFGRRGDGDGELSFPTSLAFDADGNLFVVDQLNARVQLFSEEGEYLDAFGALGVGFANFVRPKDVAVDEAGLIYVTDNAFNNVQILDADFTLLTFVGDGGGGPGQFHGASGVAVHGNEFAVVDQLGRRLQVFRFIAAKTE